MTCFFFLTYHYENSELTLLVTAVVESVDLQLPLKQQLHGGNGNNGTCILQLITKNLEDLLAVEDEDSDCLVLA